MTDQNHEMTVNRLWPFSLIVAVVMLPLVLVAALTVVQISENDVRQWLPKGFEEAEKHDWFTQNFGVDEMIVASWDGCAVDDPRLQKFAERLREQKKPDGTTIYDRVLTGAELQAQIINNGVSEKAAQSRLKGVFVGPDGKQTCLLAFPSKKCSKDRLAVLENLERTAKSSIDLDPDAIHMGGPTVDGAAIDSESKKSLRQFIGLTVIAVFTLCLVRLRNLKLSLIVLFFSGYSAMLALAILYWTGGKMNLTMIMLPTLIFILTVSGCVHMVNYFDKAARSGNKSLAAIEALKGGGWPVAISSLTTAVGMISLATSQIWPIKLFGIYSAAGLVASLPIILVALPATLNLLAKRMATQPHVIDDRPNPHEKAGLIDWVCRSHWAVTIPCGIGLVFLAVGIQKLEASVKVQDRFADSTKIIQDYMWLETNLGPLVPMEVIVRFDKEKSELDEWDRAILVRGLENGIRKDELINATMSAAMFLPQFSNKRTARALAKKRTMMQIWNKSQEGLYQARMISENDDEYMYRVSVRMAAMNDLDYGDFVEVVNKQINSQLDLLAKTDHPDVPDVSGVSATLTGSIPMMYKAQHQVLKDLMYSFLCAFVLISVVLIFVLKDIRAGLVSMIPNVFPPIVVFGFMGWMGWSIEIGSVMTASVALGIAVDDTVHFLTWYRRAIEAGKARYEAIKHAFSHCAKAMIDTTLICGLGVACFMFSVFMPTVKFARLLLILLSVALVGDLILLPAILASPLGKWFQRKPSTNEDNEAPKSSATIPPPNGRPTANGKNLTQTAKKEANKSAINQ